MITAIVGCVGSGVGSSDTAGGIGVNVIVGTGVSAEEGVTKDVQEDRIMARSMIVD